MLYLIWLQKICLLKLNLLVLFSDTFIAFYFLLEHTAESSQGQQCYAVSIATILHECFLMKKILEMKLVVFI